MNQRMLDELWRAGTPMVGTDGEMVGGSMKQSEKGRTKGLYSHAF